MRPALLSLLLLLGCAPWNQPQNQPLAGENAPLADPATGEGELYVGLAFSGGGMRATAFAYGMLEELRAAGLLSEVRLVSGVSGEGVTELLRAAWAEVKKTRGEVSDEGEHVIPETPGGWRP